MKNKMIVPKLRFSGFESSWEINSFVNSFDFLQTNTFSRSQMDSKDGTIRNIHYGDILTIYNYTLNDVSVVPYLNADVNVEKFREESYIQNGDIIIADTAEDLSAGKVIEVSNVTGDILAGLHTMLCRPKKVLAKNYWGYYLNSKAYRKTLTPMITGTKVYSISKSNISKTLVCSPKEKEEQQKIADCLTSLDDLINAENKKFELLKDHKKGLMQKLFPTEVETMPEWRFPDFRDSGEWEKETVKNIISTLSPPQKLLSTQYGKSGDFPIIDQSQEYICGWTNDEKSLVISQKPLIIFGDHTCCLKYVTIPFAQGADGIKIILTNDRLEPLFLYQYFLHDPIKSDRYKRHFSDLKEKIISFPKKETGEQQKIADCLSSVDNLISEQVKRIEQLKKHKKGLMQGLFPSIEEVE